MTSETESTTEKTLEEGKKILFDATEKIFEIRISSSNIEKYNKQKESEFLLFKYDLPYCSAEEICQCYSGLVGESLFFLACEEKSIPIRISSGQEDWEGIDFYIFGYPVDVTINYTKDSLEKKIDAKRCSTIFLPRFIGDSFLSDKPNKCIPYTKSLFETGAFDTTRYLQDIISINHKIKDIIEKEISLKDNRNLHLEKVGINSLHNIDTILKLISSRL